MSLNRIATTLLAAGALLAASAAWAQFRLPPDTNPLIREGVTVTLAPHTWAIPDGNVTLVPNVGIVVGSRATLVIDPGLGRRSGEAVLREVAKVSRNTELYVASTHFHVEHTMGYLAFPPTAKYVNSTAQEAEFAEGGLPQVKAFSAFSPIVADLLKDATEGRKADITFDKEYTLDLGGVRVRMLMVGPTHTKGDTGFFVEGDNVLFAGDVVMNTSFVAASQVTSVKAWLAAFDQFERLKPATIVPAHGEIGPGSLVAANRAAMARIQARSRELKAQGKTADETATTVRSELAAQYPTWARANSVAAAARAAWREAD
jgi:glyoxylase-like metal-dependent hydrolase (beta-lactamase superfamily II)